MSMTTSKQSPRVYVSPQVSEVKVCGEGLLCSSIESLDKEFNYNWDEE